MGYLCLGVCGVVGVLPDRGCIFRSGSFIAPRSLQLCLSHAAQKTFLGGVLLTEFPQCGLECSHPALPEREITQVNQQIDRLVVFVGLPLCIVVTADSAARWVFISCARPFHSPPRPSQYRTAEWIVAPI